MMFLFIKRLYLTIVRRIRLALFGPNLDDLLQKTEEDKSKVKEQQAEFLRKFEENLDRLKELQEQAAEMRSSFTGKGSAEIDKSAVKEYYSLKQQAERLEIALTYQQRTASVYSRALSSLSYEESRLNSLRYAQYRFW